MPESTGSPDEEPPSILDTTFSTYKISPLYLSRPLTTPRLRELEHRLRDTLVGDVVRGVQVGLGRDEDGSLGRAGPLERVQISWAETDMILPASNDDEDNHQEHQALLLDIQYENAICTAYLLPRFYDDAQEAGDQPRAWAELGEAQDKQPIDSTKFKHLPLLLLRMPAPLKPIIIDFLSNTFDCRISMLRLDTKTLIRIWETWLRDSAISGPTSKDLAITVGFDISKKPQSPKPKPHLERGDKDSQDGGDHEDESEEVEEEEAGLRTMEIIIPHDNLRKFAQRGQELIKDQYQDRDRNDAEPFMAALARYLDHYLALDLFHPRVRVTKIACGGFVLSEGRVKLFSPGTAATRRLVADLTATAAVVRTTIRS